MAYDLPDNTDPKRWTTIARGRAEWEQFLSFKRGYVRLDPDLREFFKDDGTVNQALRQAMVLMKLSRARGDKKTA